MDEKGVLKIFRFDPGVGIPEYKQYEVPVKKGLTVLEALFYIAQNYDDPPAFRRYQCNRGQCTGCVMTIDHRTQRACTTQVKREMVIEPLYDYPVIRDLVVDFGKKVHKEGGGYYRIKEGTIILRSNFKIRDRFLLEKKFFMKIDQVKCLGCKDKSCVRACWVNLYENLESRGGERLPLYSAPIKIIGGVAHNPGICSVCLDAPCIDKCPVHCIGLTPQGTATKINTKKCIGCGLCVDSCQMGNIWMNLERGFAVKCDLCEGDPECVKACPYDAIEFLLI